MRVGLGWRGRRTVIAVVAVCGLGLGAGAVPAAGATDYTWAGTATSDDWSAAANWSGAVAPSGSVGTLTFPQLPSSACSGDASTSDACYDAFNDVSGISANALSIDDNEPYDLDENPIALGAGGLTAAPDSAANGGSEASLGLPVTLTAAQTWTIDGGSYGDGLTAESVSGPSDPLTVDFTGGSFLELFTGETGDLTLSGSGTLVLADPEGLSTPARGAPGVLNTNGNLVTVDGGASLIAPYANTETGPLSVPDGTVLVGEGAAPDGTLQVGGALSLTATSDVTFFVDQPGTTASSDYSSLSAQGDVNLDGANLALDQGADSSGDCDDLNPGDVDTLISTSGTLSGTFHGIPDGSTVTITNDCDTSTTSATATINYTATSVTATIVAAGNAGDAPQNTGSAPTISGTVQAGDTLTAAPGAWSGNPTFSYQWYACTSSSSCAPITGATSPSYVIASGEVGDTLAVAVTGSNAAGSNTADSELTAAVAAAPVIVPLANVSVPTVSGTDVEGDTLSTTNGEWSGGPTSYTYFWLRCAASGPDCTVIGGATSATYTLTSADVGYRIESSVTPHNANGTSSAVPSAPTSVIAASATTPAAKTPPTISLSTPIVGQKLTATGGTFSGTAPLSYAYAWELCPHRSASDCHIISGATARTYTPTSADAGDGLRFVVAADNSAGVAYGLSSITGDVVGEPQIKPGLRHLLTPGGQATNIATLLKRGGDQIAYTALAAGRLTLTWTATVEHRHIVVATAALTLRTAATKTLRLRLTSAGRRLLRTDQTQRVTAAATFRLTDAFAVTQTRTLELRR